MRGRVSAIIVGVIVILTLGMLLPQLLRRREDASRVYCLQNLHRLHAALVLYHEQHDALPPAVAPARGLPPEQRVSWQALLLPCLGEDRVFAQVDWQSGWHTPANEMARETALRSYQCPSAVPPQAARQTNLTHYPGLTGLGSDAVRLPLDHPRAGCFGYWREVTFAYIRDWDGTSATILIMETAHQNGPWLAGGLPTARGLDPARHPYIGGDGQFGGSHLAGAQALFADGSARIQAPSINPRVLEALVTFGGN